jgi:hypothetical protein
LVSLEVNGRNTFANAGKVGIAEFSKKGIALTSSGTETCEGATASGAGKPAPPVPVLIEGALKNFLKNTIEVLDLPGRRDK